MHYCFRALCSANDFCRVVHKCAYLQLLRHLKQKMFPLSLSLSLSHTHALSFSLAHSLSLSPLSAQVESVCYDHVALSVNEAIYSSVSELTLTLGSLRPLTLCCIKVFQNAICMEEELTGLPVQMCNTTLADAPECPANLNAIPTSYRSLLVQWDTPSNAVLGLNYTVRIETVETDPAVPIPLEHSLDNTFAFVNGLEPNTSYNVSLSVAGMEGSGGSSGECTYTVGNTPIGTPPAPVNVKLTSGECTLIGSWSDPAKSSYNVTNYLAYARCNDIIFMDNISSDAMSVNFSICDASGTLRGGDLSWCTLQVQGCDGFSCGQLSELALTMVPDSKPGRPLCFITEEVGSRVLISYTLPAPFALEYLFVKYSLMQTSDMSLINGDNKPFDGNNVLSFPDLFRGQEYSFSLQLCDDNGTKCGESCNIIFVPNTVSAVTA